MPLGCKRVTPSDTYLSAFNLSNVHLITDKIEKLNSNGIKTIKDQYDLDVIIYATGFDVLSSARAAAKIIGKGGKILGELMGNTPKAYRGTSYPNYPNAFTILGPNTGLGHNSIIFVIELMVDYAIGCIKETIENGHKVIEVKGKATELYNKDIQNRLKDKIWATGCVAWYSNADGYNWTLWPEDLTSYWWESIHPNYQDYNFS